MRGCTDCFLFPSNNGAKTQHALCSWHAEKHNRNSSTPAVFFNTFLSNFRSQVRVQNEHLVTPGLNTMKRLAAICAFKKGKISYFVSRKAQIICTWPIRFHRCICTICICQFVSHTFGRGPQCDQIGWSFESSWWPMFLQKLPKFIENVSGFLKNNSHVRTPVATFWG